MKPCVEHPREREHERTGLTTFHGERLLGQRELRAARGDDAVAPWGRGDLGNTVAPDEGRRGDAQPRGGVDHLDLPG